MYCSLLICSHTRVHPQSRDDLSMVQSNYEGSRTRIEQLLVEMNEAKVQLANELEHVRKEKADKEAAAAEVGQLRVELTGLKLEQENAQQKHHEVNLQVTVRFCMSI